MKFPTGYSSSGSTHQHLESWKVLQGSEYFVTKGNFMFQLLSDCFLQRSQHLNIKCYWHTFTTLLSLYHLAQSGLYLYLYLVGISSSQFMEEYSTNENTKFKKWTYTGKYSQEVQTAMKKQWHHWHTNSVLLQNKLLNSPGISSDTGLTTNRILVRLTLRKCTHTHMDWLHLPLLTSVRSSGWHLSDPSEPKVTSAYHGILLLLHGLKSKQ